MKTLISVLTLGVGIKDWDSLEIMQREMALYERYVSRGWRVVIISTSRRDESDQNNIKEMFPDFQFVFLGMNPLIQYLKLRFSRIINIVNDREVVIRSNKLLGAHLMTYLKANRYSKTIKILRMGFNPISNYQKSGKVIKTYLFKRYMGYVLKRCDALEVTHKSLIEGFSKYIHTCVFETPNFVDNRLWEYDSNNRFSNLNHQFVYFGRFEFEKNLMNFVEAMAQGNLNGVLIGSGSLEDELRKFIHKSGARAEIWGRMSGIALVKVCKDSRFTVLVSRFEGNPKSILESLSLGVPVIVSPLTAFEGIVEDGRNGFVTKGFETEDIYACLIRAARLTDEEHRAMSENAFRSSNRFEIDQIIVKQIADYFSLLSEK